MYSSLFNPFELTLFSCARACATAPEIIHEKQLVFFSQPKKNIDKSTIIMRLFQVKIICRKVFDVKKSSPFFNVQHFTCPHFLPLRLVCRTVFVVRHSIYFVCLLSTSFASFPLCFWSRNTFNHCLSTILIKRSLHTPHSLNNIKLLSFFCIFQVFFTIHQ